MISNIWSALAIVRHAVAITIVMSAAGATVAGSMHGPSADRAQAATTTTTAAASVERTTTLVTSEHQANVSVSDRSGQSPTEHTTKNENKPVETAKPVESPKTTETKPVETPKHETTTTVSEPRHETTSNDEKLSVLVKDCLVKYAAAKNAPAETSAASEACRKAIRASGLSPRDFWLRFGPKTTATAKPELTKKPEPTKKPETVTTPTVSTAQLEVLVKDCFAKYLTAKNTKQGGDAAVEACHKAMAASGLTGDAFWDKFGRPGSS